MTGFVYAIQSGDAVKLGWSNDPWRRIAQLNVAHRDKYELLGFVAGTAEQERELHHLCAADRIRGEWFRKGRAVSLFIDHLPPLPAKPANSENTRLCSTPSTAIGAAIRRAISAAGSEGKLAKMVGVSQPMINHAKKAERVSAALAVKIDAALAGAVSKEDLCPETFAQRGDAA